ncbi:MULTISPECIES: hypothetical protein [unclassified Rhizobium]|uniref:hypothetical protein n=1 Tax=unclassified Rhizobium TaxID=2613769 RepID=UPI002180AFC8|nr:MULTISPECIES: hypothetical protein [unclassified Rhizobium]
MRGFLFGGDTGKKQNEISDERKRLAHAMLQQGMDASPVQSPWQGAARLVQALMGGLAMRRQEQEMGADEPGNDNFAPLPGNPPVPGDRPLYAPLPAASDGRQQPAAAPAAQKGEKPGEISPQTQAEFFLQEDPRLIARLNAAKSLEEAQRLMNRAWAFKGYDEPGNEEVAHRLTRARSFMPQFQTQGAADPFALPDTPPIPTPRPASGNPRETMNRGREGAGAALVNALLARL